MRVGIISYDFYPPIGGQGVYVHEIHKRLHEHGITPYVFSSREGDGAESCFSYKVPNPVSFSLIVNKRINKWVKEHELDLVHVQGGPGGVLLFKKPAVPLVYTAHHLYSQQYEFLHKPVYAFLKHLEKVGYLRSDRIVAVSSTTRDSLVQKYNIPESKIEIIPDGVDFTDFKPLILEKIPDSVLYVGRLCERKGIRYLIEAISIIKRKKQDIKLYIVGTGALEGELRKMVTDYSLNDTISLLGGVSQEELVKWYNHAEVFVLPSLFEGFGIVCIEAMACGTPVIGTDVPGIIDIIENQKTGSLVSSRNAEKLAGAIEQLLTNKDLRLRLGQAGRDKALRNYSWDDITKKIAQLYVEVGTHKQN
jgi:glycosyltransferase involved in cell wall biosynthesis